MEPEGEREETHNPDPTRLSLSLKKSQASKALPGGNMRGKRDTSSRQHDPNTTRCN